MYIYDLDAHGHTATAEDRRVSFSSRDSDENSFATAAESRTNSGLGVANSGLSNPRPMTSSQLTPATALSSNWPGGILRRIDIRVESKELLEPRSAAAARPQSRPLSRGVAGDGRRTSLGEDEAWDEVASFLRNVTPPPSNFMSIPTEPYSPTSVSSRSSMRRRTSKKKKKGALRRCISFLRGASRQRKVLRKPPVRPVSPTLARSPARKQKKRPPRITLPDTAISGRTVDGHRHIAISIPVEHAHLGPEPRLRFPRAERRTRSMPVVDMNPAVYSDVNVRPMTAFFSEPHVGTQLGPVAEERESLSSRSWERSSQGGLDEARKVRLASRHTFGTVQEELSRPNTSSMSPPKTPRRVSDDSWAPRTSDETRESMHRQALAALQRPRTAPRPISGQSGYSFRSFTSASPASKVSYPMRKSSLHPQGPENRRSRARSDSDQRAQNERSRDSSRDQYTLQESIFSVPSFLDSYGTVASGSELELGVIKEAKRAKRFSGTAEIVDTPPRTSLEAGEASGRENARASAREKKRGSGHDSKRSSGHASRRSSKRSSKRSSGTIEEEESFVENARGSTATVLFNPEVKKVDKSITRQLQSRRSVEIVVENPADTEFPRGESEAKDKETVEDQKPSSEVFKQEGQGEEGKGTEKQQLLQESPMLDVPVQREEPKGKGKGKAASAVLEIVDNGDEQKPKAKAQNEETTQSPLPSPKQRKEKRKSRILTRSQRIAELKKALDMPGSEPKDLVWRRLSVSSDGSSSSTEKEANADPKDILVHVPVVPENNPYSLKTTPVRFGLSAVMTVADVRPSSPLTVSPVLGVEKKNSLPMSVSSPATVATAVMTSPVPPFRGLGSVTPPDSPPQSRSSSSEISSLETQTQATALKHPPLKRLGSLRRRPSVPGRQSPALSGRISPSMQESTPRPKTAGKGVLASRKDFYGGRQTPESPEQDRGEVSTSVLKMSRSEIFDRYEALREKQTRDMEKRLERLERNGDYWLTSMLPLLKDLSQTLGDLAKGNGKEVDQEAEAPDIRTTRRPETSYHTDDRRNRFSGGADEQRAGPGTRRRCVPGDDALESDEEIVRHPHVPTDRSRANTGLSERSRRLYLDDHPDLGRRVSDYDHAADQRRSRSRSYSRHRLSQTAGGQKPMHPGTLSGTTTMIDSSGARTSSMGTVSRAAPNTNAANATAGPQRLQDEVDAELERIRRVERLNERIDSHMRGLSLELGRRGCGWSPPRLSSSSRARHGGLTTYESRSEASLGTYAARPDESGGRAYYSGMHTVEPIMRELQFGGSRLSLESSGSGGFDGDSEVRRLREGPRAVIGFGAFGGHGL